MQGRSRRSGFAVTCGTYARASKIVHMSQRPAGRAPGDRGTHGQALVEFALVVPIMVLIFAALVQFAFIFERQIGIENAVRDGARRGATYQTDSTNAATNATFVWNTVFGTGGLFEKNVQGYDGTLLQDPKVCYREDTGAAGFTIVLVKVSVTYRHPLFLPLITQIIDGIDGHVDNAFWVATSSEFTVQDDPAANASVGGTPVGFPAC